jgi:microcin C transport system permease protein
MMWNYMRFDFGESYFRRISVVDLVIEKSCRFRSRWACGRLVIAYIISIPLGIARRCGWLPLRCLDLGPDHRGLRDPGFLFAILLLVLFAGGIVFDRSSRCGG